MAITVATKLALEAALADTNASNEVATILNRTQTKLPLVAHATDATTVIAQLNTLIDELKTAGIMATS